MDDPELSAMIRTHASRHRASDALRAGIRTQIALNAAQQNLAPAALSRTQRWWQRWSTPALLGFACGVLLTAAVVWLAPLLQTQPLQPALLVASHVRALKAGALIDVASSDRHTVKPWFQGKLDYAPQVIDLEAAGFPLLGGRVDTLAGSPTAVLVYLHRRHVMTVFVRPAEAPVAPQRSQVSGFNVLHWSDGAMHVWAVTDLEAAELDRFGDLWRKGALPR